MGCCLSCRSSSSFNVIRVVHLNGYVEDFDYPVTVTDIAGKSSKHFVCTSVQLQLLSTGVIPLAPKTQLEPGRFYFILPYSVFQSDTSPVDMVTLATRLTAIAKRGCSDHKPPHTSLLSNIYRNSTRCNISTATTVVNRFSDGVRSMDQESDVVICRELMSSRAQSWKPILETINERSFSLRCESDLLSKQSVSPK